MPPPNPSPNPTNNPAPAKAATDALGPLTAALKALTEASRGLLAQQTAMAKELDAITDKFHIARAAFRTFTSGLTDSIKTFAAGLEFLKPITLKISESIRGTFSAVSEKIQPILGGIEKIITSAWEKIGDNVKPIVGGVFGTIATVIRTTMATATQFAAGFVKLGGALVDGVKAASHFAGAVAGIFRGIAEGGVSILSGAMRALDAGVMAISHNVGRFVAKIDPSAMFRFEYALDSLYATIGSALIPVLNQFADMLRSIGSAIAGTTDRGRSVIAAISAGTVGLIAFGAAMAVVQTIATSGPLALLGATIGAIGGVLMATGQLQPLFDAMAGSMSGLLDQMGGALNALTSAFLQMLPIFDGVGKQFLGFFSYLIDVWQRAIPDVMGVAAAFMSLAEPLLKVGMILYSGVVEGMLLLYKALNFVAPLFVYVGEVISTVIQRVMKVIQDLFALIGVDIDTDFSKRAKDGPLKEPLSPVRQASFGGVEDVLKRAMSASYSLGSGTGKKPEAITAENTSSIANQVARLRQGFDNLSDWFTKMLPILLVEEGPRAVGGFIEKVWKGAVGGVKDTAREAGNFVDRNAQSAWDGLKESAESVLPDITLPRIPRPW